MDMVILIFLFFSISLSVTIFSLFSLLSLLQLSPALSPSLPLPNSLFPFLSLSLWLSGLPCPGGLVNNLLQK